MATVQRLQWQMQPLQPPLDALASHTLADGVVGELEDLV